MVRVLFSRSSVGFVAFPEFQVIESRDYVELPVQLKIELSNNVGEM